MNRLQSLQETLTADKHPKVVIVGGGTCGLLALRYLKPYADVVCLEGKSEVGGQWKFDGPHNEFNHPNLQQDPFYRYYGCLQSSVYEDLITNVPKQFMTFRDFPHKADTPTFMGSDVYHKYILDYVEHFKLRENILTNQFVVNVHRNTDLATNKKFTVTTCSSLNIEGEKRTFAADYVVVCNGHQSDPFIP